MPVLRLHSLLLFALLLAACGGGQGRATPPAPPSGGVAYPSAQSTLPPGGYPGPAQVEIVYSDSGITPAQVSIPAGSSVVFKIESGQHQPYSLEPAGLFDASAPLGAGQRFTFTFANAGTVQLGCRLHSEMQAVIEVTP